MTLVEKLSRHIWASAALRTVACFVAVCGAVASALPSFDNEPTVLDHFMAEVKTFDFANPDNGLRHVLRFDLDVTGDGQADVFLGTGPTGRSGTYWYVYSPGPRGRFASLGRVFFHPSGFCCDAEERLFLLSQRVEPHRHVVAGYRFSASGAEWVRSSKEISDLDTPIPEELRDLSKCPTKTEVLSASPYEVAQGLPAWEGLLSRELVDPQPPSLGDLKLRSPKE